MIIPYDSAYTGIWFESGVRVLEVGQSSIKGLDRLVQTFVLIRSRRAGENYARNLNQALENIFCEQDLR